MNPPTPSLRRIFHDSNRASKVSLSIPAGDVLEVSADVAAQLLLTSAQFKDAKPKPAPRKPAAKKVAAVRVETEE